MKINKEKLKDNSFFLLLNKDEGITSNQVLQKVKWLLFDNEIKGGFAGILDPIATGLLIIGFNQATKFLSFFSNMDKEYEAVIKLGSQTSTDDKEGEIIHQKKINFDFINESRINEVLTSFLGNSQQITPIYSALKINGQRMYQMARKGEFFNPKKRLIHVSKIKLLCFKNDLITFQLTCSKGTYVRAIARDIGLKLNCYAHLYALKRKKIGNLNLNLATTFSNLKTWKEKNKDLDDYSQIPSVLSINQAFDFKSLIFTKQQIFFLNNGNYSILNPLIHDDVSDGWVYIYNQDKLIMGVTKIESRKIKKYVKLKNTKD